MVTTRRNAVATTDAGHSAPSVAPNSRRLRSSKKLDASPLRELKNEPMRQKRARQPKKSTRTEKGLYFEETDPHGSDESSELDFLKEKNASLLHTLTDLEHHHTDLQETYATLLDNHNNLQNNYTTLQADYEIALEQAACANDKCSTAQAKLSEVEEKSHNSQQHFEGLVASLETKLDIKTKEANTLRSEFARYRLKYPDTSPNGGLALLHKVEASANIDCTEIDRASSSGGAYNDEYSVDGLSITPRSASSFVSAAGSPLASFAVQSPEPAVETPTPSAVQSPELVVETPAPSAVQSPEAVDETPAPSTPTMSSRLVAESPTAPPTATDQSQTEKRRWLFGTTMSSTFSAFKSSLVYFSTPRFPKTTPASLKRKPSPEPGSLTETLTPSPTPVGERTKTERSKSSIRKSMHTLLTRGMKEEEKALGEAWASRIAEDFSNDPDAGEKRKRLEVPVLLDDLKTLPPHRPWECGFGDPLAEYDDDDVVPVWAVYQAMMAEEEHQRKKHKSIHEATVEDDIPSLNDTFNSNGNSASLQDLHPRSSVVPSPMFSGNSRAHEHGRNVFTELHDRAGFTEKPERIPHNPAKGSFSCPESDSDSDEMSDNEQEDASLWTQPPPAAPVPAHASLPVSMDMDENTSHEPMNEVQRERAKWMKHTPAKPSRLRMTNFPSPSIVSESGTPVQVQADPIPGMPEPEGLEFYDPEVEAHTRAYVDTDRMHQDAESFCKGDIILSYSDDESMTDE